jgi:DNA-binding HxlR family transcriptional regulator
MNNLILNSAVAEGLDVIGDRWTLLILREAFYGRSRFEEFIQHTGASRSTLTRRLSALVDSDILYKRPYSNAPNRFEYKFTEHGMGLLGASLLAQQWESQWSKKTKVSKKSALFHTRCHHALSPMAICRHCKMALVFDDVSWLHLDQELDNQLDAIRSMNKQRRIRDTPQSKSRATDLVDLVGDRWTLLILISAFFGTCRYDDFIKQLNIAPGILSERLKAMVSGSIMSRHRYQQKPPRYEYRLSDKGKSVYPFIMALRQWVVDSLPASTPAPALIHTHCKQPLVVDVACEHCHEKPWPQDIKFSARA